MRNLNVFLSALIISLFCLTSCQKESVENVTLKDTNTIAALDNQPISIAETTDEVATTFTEEINAKMTADKPEVVFDETLMSQQGAKSRNGEDIILFACVPQKAELRCGDSFITSNDNDCNSVSDGLYASRGYNSNLNGGDNIYYFDATHDMEVTFTANTLPANRGNLAMFLFEGDFIINSNRAVIRRVVAASSSSSIFSEELNRVFLQRGRRYILIVDSAPNRGADYRLTVSCGGPDCDDFEAYRTGAISPQNPTKWEKWDFNSQDGQVRNNGFQYMSIIRDPFTGSQFQQDVIHKTGNIRTGVRSLTMDMWVFRGHSGYFNIQKQLRQEFGAQLYFHDRGIGEIRIANQIMNFNYPQDAWMNIELVFNFNTGNVNFLINGNFINTWPIRYSATTRNGSSQVAGIDFFAAKTDTEYFIDNICLN